MQSTKRWYALYTKPQWEKKVADLLTRKSIENYCPVNKIQRQWSDRKKTILRPLFTSYVFVNLTDAEHLLARSTNGVINFVYWLNKPAVIQNEEIEAIKNFLSEHDYVQLERMPVKQDDAVKITNGALIGQKGQIISVNNKYIKIFLPSLGFMMQAHVKSSNVELIDKKELHLFKNVETQYNITG